MCIDATEVMVGQYAEFVTARAGDASGQSPECAWNLYFAQADDCAAGLSSLMDPLRPQTCVDWCDAAAFCAWSGKRLCGGIDGRGVAMADLADASKDAWYNACSSGGINHYPFGDTCNAMPCILGGLTSLQVPAGHECQASGVYRGVWDLIGNVAEWEDSCTRDPLGGGSLDRCQTRGSHNGGGHGYVGTCGAWDDSGVAWCSSVPVATTRPARGSASSKLGFRCCGQ